MVTTVLRLFVALVALLVVLALPLISAPPRAQAADSRRYEQLIKDAVSEFGAGNFAEARALFAQAHALQPSARTLRGLGMTSFQLRHYVQAQSELSAALADKAKPLTAAQRDEVSKLLERAGDYIGVVELDVTPAEATMLVDGNPTSDRTLTLDLGEYHLTARARGFQDAELRVNVEGRKTQRLKVELEPIDLNPSSAALPASPAPASSRAPAASASDTNKPSVFKRWWFWSAVGVVVAGAVTTAVLVGSHSAPKPETGDVGKTIATLRVSP